MTSPVDYVVDTTIVVQHLITDVHTPHVDVLVDALGDRVMLHLPEFCLLECGNVLWKRVRFHGMPQKDAEGLIETLIAFPFKVIPVSGLLK